MNESQRKINLLSIGVMLLLEMLWAYVCLYTNIFSSWLPASVSTDVFYYVASIFLAFFSFLALHFLFRSKLSFPVSDSRKRETVLELLTMAVFAVIGALVFLNEKRIYFAADENMPWHTNSRIEYLVLLAAGLLFCQIRIWIKAVRWHKTGKERLWFFYAVLAALAGYAVYAPNSFRGFYNLYHANAYFHSVYRVLQHQPYNAVNCGVYGFYGIVLAPFVKLCGGTFHSFVVVMAVLAVLCMLCYFYVLEHLTSSRIIRVLGCIGIIGVTTAYGTNIHLQTYPGRLLSAGFTLAWIVRKAQFKETRRNVIVGRICSLMILSLSLLWNMETGLGCVLAFVGSEIVELLQKHSLQEKIFWKKAVFKVLWLPASFLAAFLSVGVYNLVVSGKFISFREFLFPFIGGSGYVQLINLPLELFPSVWMLISVLMFLAIAVVLSTTDLCKSRKTDASVIYLAACTINCIVQMVCYVNRSVRLNLFMLTPLLILMTAGLTDYLGKKEIWNKNAFGNGILRGGAACGMLVLVLSALLTCSNGPALEVIRDENRDMEAVYGFVDTVQKEIPKDTLGIGIGVPELYSYLGWDTGYYGIDVPDFPIGTDEAKAYAYELLSETDEVFIAEYGLELMTECADGALDSFYETHQLKQKYEFGAGIYLFYERIEEN